MAISKGAGRCPELPHRTGHRRRSSSMCRVEEERKLRAAKAHQRCVFDISFTTTARKEPTALFPTIQLSRSLRRRRRHASRKSLFSSPTQGREERAAAGERPKLKPSPKEQHPGRAPRHRVSTRKAVQHTPRTATRRSVAGGWKALAPLGASASTPTTTRKSDARPSG